jgi:group I intron endonuclease
MIDQPGIYIIHNKVNDKVYVGSSVDTPQRHSAHVSRLKRNRHFCKHLQNAWNHYGADSFEFKLIEHVPDVTMLISREQFWLDHYKNIGEVYNKAIRVDRPSLGLVVSAETKKKQSEQRRGEKHPLYGKHHSEETKRKISDAKRGYVPSQETLLKISAALKGRSCWNKGKHYTLHPMSEEHKRKLSEIKKRYYENGGKPWALGKKFTAEHRAKQSAAKLGKYDGVNNPNYGKHMSEEHKMKLRTIHLGRPLSEETKRKISVAHSGSNNYMFGKHHTDATRRKISETRIRKCIHLSKEAIQKLVVANTGRHHSEEAKQKIRIARLKSSRDTFGRFIKTAGIV